ncbi:GNAT family N-acetyltransferase [Falsiroseomonas oryziterrae]|uniref:GNAT family N-acetyltransferase n=1 Tax=Falsiroseomonas oryziterrae TaxID=2911368 RepID=UPI001F17B4B3|nr:GNAT family N-acetyltransferase [Roseomonas sp. NPKOSM-4]
MICVRRARPDDAPGIAAVHVAAWRSAYAGILDEAYLAKLSETRLAAFYTRAILDRRDGHAVFVATAGGQDQPGDAPGPEAAIVGFASGGRARRRGLAEGEVETLYVLDDFRERAIGRRLMRAMAAHLRVIGCGSALVWVLAENPARYFYAHLGGKEAMTDMVTVAGRPVKQTAFTWPSIEALLSATAQVKES